MQLTVPASKMKSHQDDRSARFTRLRISHFMLLAAELSQRGRLRCNAWMEAWGYAMADMNSYSDRYGYALSSKATHAFSSVLP